MGTWTVWFHTISFGPRVHVPWGAGGQSLGNLKKCYIAFSFMPTPFYDIMSAVRCEGQCDLYLADYFIYEGHT